MKRFVAMILPPVLVFVASMAAAELWVRWGGVRAWLVPPPSQVCRVAWEQREDLLWGLAMTGGAALCGFLLAAIVGVLAAVLLSTSRLVQRAFYPYTVFFQTVPVVAVAPLLVLWLGFGQPTVIAAAFIVSVFPVIANTLTGLLSVDPALRDLFRLYGAGPLATLWKLKLPGALPNIFTGLRIASGLAVIGAIIGDMVSGSAGGFGGDFAAPNSTRASPGLWVLSAIGIVITQLFSGSPEHQGLGGLLMGAKRHLDTAQVFSAILTASLLGLLLFGAINLAAWRMLRRWHASA